MRRAPLAIALSLALGVCLWAEDFWEKKKFADWNEKEVRQVMTNSPWARRVDVAISGFGDMGGGGGGRGRRGGGGGGMGGGGMSAGGVDAGGDPSGGGGGGAIGPRSGVSPETTSVPRVPVLVRWQTALPVKQAMVKGRLGAEAGTSPEAAKILERQEQYYIISVSGLPGRMLQGSSPEKVKAETQLKIGKLEIHPVDIKMNTSQPAMVEVYLVFPKSQEGGHVITLDDKEVELIARLGSLDVRRKFRLKDMVFDGKLEL